MAGLRFLERLRRVQQAPNERITIQPEDVLRSVTNYVSKILNTRQGSTVLADDFGMPDFSSAGIAFTNEDIPKIEKDLARFIENYEIRLTNVVVTFTPDDKSPLHMNFSVSADLKLNANETLPVHLITRVSSQGQVTVSH